VPQAANCVIVPLRGLRIIPSNLGYSLGRIAAPAQGYLRYTQTGVLETASFPAEPDSDFEVSEALRHRGYCEIDALAARAGEAAGIEELPKGVSLGAPPARSCR